VKTSQGHSRPSGAGDLRAFLRAVARRRLAAAIIEGFAFSTSLVGLAALVLFAADRLTFFPPALRLVLSLGLVAVTGWILFTRVARPALRAACAVGAAAFLEERFGELDGFVLSAAQLRVAPSARSSAPSPSLVDETVAEAARRLGQKTPADAVGLAPPMRRTLAFAAVAVLWAAAFSAFRADVAIFFARFVRPTADIRYPARTRIISIKAPAVLPEGGVFSVEVAAEGFLPQQAAVKIDDGTARRVIYAERLDGGRYAASLASVRRDFVFSVALAGAVSRKRAVRVVPPPRLVGMTCLIEYPAYVELPAVEVPGGDFIALEGSRARAKMHFNKPVKSAAAVFEDGRRIEAVRSGDALAADFQFRVSAPTSYRVLLRDEHGFTNDADSTYNVRVRADAAPMVALTRPDRDLTVVPDAVIPVEGEAGDDSAVHIVTLEYTVERDGGGGEKGRLILDASTGSRRSVKVDYLWDLSTLKLQPGDRLTWRLAAEDDFPGGPNRSESRARRAHVVSVEAKLAELDRLSGRIAGNLRGIERRQRAAAEDLSAVAGRGRP